MPYCPSCGKEVEGDAKFCKECGHATSTSKPKANLKNKSIIGVILLLIIVFGCIALVALLIIFYFPVTYTATEIYTEQVPYTAIEYYDEQVPITVEECRQKLDDDLVTLIGRGISNLDKVLEEGDPTKLLEVCEKVYEFKTVKKSREVTKFKTVDKERTVTKTTTLYMMWTDQVEYRYRV